MLSAASRKRPWPSCRFELSISIIGEPEKPGCVDPSITTASVMAGSLVRGLMVWCPLLMLKLMMSGPGLELASMIACRNEPGPLSLTVVTPKVVAAFAVGSTVAVRTETTSRELMAVSSKCEQKES